MAKYGLKTISFDNPFAQSKVTQKDVGKPANFCRIEVVVYYKNSSLSLKRVVEGKSKGS